MGLLIVLIVALVLAGTMLALGYNLRVFRIEKSDLKEFPEPIDFQPLDLPPENVWDMELPSPQHEEASSPDLVDLFHYFNEEEEEVLRSSVESSEESATEQKEDEFDTEYDRLCNLKNGFTYIQDCQKALNQAREADVLYAAVCFDIDRFRFINSLKGHSIGDYILTRISQEIVFLFPDSAIISRLSADFFTVVFPMMGEEGIWEEYADGLRKICEKIRTDVGLKSPLRICMGIAITTSRDIDYDAALLLEKANIARHCIKTSRNESYQVYSDKMVTTYLFEESALEDYNENQYDDDFNLYYQPIASVSRNRVIGSDALARWICDEESNKEVETSPENGRILTNGRKVIYQVCRAMSRWRKAGKEVLPVYTPLTVTELFLEDYDSFLSRCLSEFQLEPPVLCLMINAASLRVDWQIAASQIQKLRDMGVTVGIFGIDASYSSLNFLDHLHVDFVKLHHSVARHAGASPTADSFIQHIIGYCEPRHMDAIFEGVDSKDHADTLKELGVTLMQGRYSGKANQADEFVRTLPEYLVNREAYNQDPSGNTTVILDDNSLRQGDFRVY